MPAELPAALADPGFTPGARHIDPLFGLLGGADRDQAEAAEKALLRLGPAVGTRALDRLAGAAPPLRGRLARLVGKAAALEGGKPLLAGLFALLADSEPKTRRNAILALGKLRPEGTEAALLALWTDQTSLEHRRSLASSLGKAGGPRSLALLRSVKSDDPELSRLASQAVLMLSRTGGRASPSRVVTTRSLDAPLPVLFHVRKGLEQVLLDEIAELLAPARVVGAGLVKGTLSGPIDRLFQARTWLDVAFPVPWAPLAGRRVPEVLASCLTSPEARAVFAAFTEGQVRYRIAWADGAHHRADVWQTAREVSAIAPELINDPTQSTWEAQVSVSDETLRVELAPRAMQDPRFAYRGRDVPAASHPTLAAALARVAGARPGDIVWDPFTGSGLELIERARLGPVRALHASDTDPEALSAARDNAEKAGVTLDSAQLADARTHRVPGVTLIVTNPPMGRRVGRHDDLGALLDAFLDNVAPQLASGGRLVWISPMAERTARRARALGLAISRVGPVDMGGFTAELQIFRRAAGPQPELPLERRPRPA